MENKWIDRCMMCLEVLMNFLVIFCLETVIFGSFPDLEKILEAENGQFGAPGLFRQILLMAVPFLFLLIRAKAAHFMSFVALHGAVAAGAVLLLGQGTAQRVCFGVFVSIYLMLSFMLRISKQRIGEGQLGAVAGVVALLFHRTGQLAQSDDRHVHLFGHDLEVSGDGADLLHAVLAALAAGHQL